MQSYWLYQSSSAAIVPTKSPIHKQTSAMLAYDAEEYVSYLGLICLCLSYIYVSVLHHQADPRPAANKFPPMMK